MLRVAREHDVDVLSVQELRPQTVRARFETGATSSSRSAILEPERGAGGSGLLSRAADDARPACRRERGDRDRRAARRRSPIRSVHPRPPVSQRRRARVARRDRRAARRGRSGDVRSSPATSTPRSTTPSSARCSTAATSTPADAAGAGLKPTWPAPPRQRRALPLTIDHVLVDRRVRVERVTVVRIPRSDHRAVIAVLRLPSGR